MQGDEAFVTYLCVAKGGKRFRNTEFFVFAGDKVKRIDVYFGAAYENGAIRQAERTLIPDCRDQQRRHIPNLRSNSSSFRTTASCPASCGTWPACRLR